jgi:hypothetical protein
MKRRRGIYGLWLAAVIGTGLLSRSELIGLPPFWAKYLGDALWALMFFIGAAIVLPMSSTPVVAAIALAICSAIEISQLYHAPWIDAVRETWPGKLLLGSVFAWADFAAYLAGIATGVATEIAASRRQHWSI